MRHYLCGMETIPKKSLKILKISKKNLLITNVKEICLEIKILTQDLNLRKKITIKENNAIYVEQKNKELGYVGKITRVDDKLIKNLIKENFIPVVSPMGQDEKKQTYNINADTAAGALATSLKSRRLMLMTDVEGVYDKNKKLISEIKSVEAEKLIYDETISEGMIPKIRTCINAVNNGVRGVVVIDGRKPHSILFELFSDKGSGTLIRK